MPNGKRLFHAVATGGQGLGDMENTYAGKKDKIVACSKKNDVLCTPFIKSINNITYINKEPLCHAFAK